MDNISQIISRSIGGYSIGSILSALLTFLICQFRAVEYA